MIQTRRRSFPYPVLSETTGDYVDGSSFDFTITTNQERRDDAPIQISFDYEITLKNKVLIEAVLDKKSQFLIEVSCSSTWFKFTQLCTEMTGTILIPAAQLSGATLISASLVVVADDVEIQLSGIHSEYGRANRFTFDIGMPLAIASPYLVELEFAEEVLRNLIHIRKSPSEPSDAFSIDLTGNQIVVNMGENYHAAWGILYANNESKPNLYMSLYKDCVAAAVQALASDGAAEEYLWARTFREKIEDLGLRIPSDPSDFNTCNEVALILLGAKGVRRITAQAEMLVK